MIKVSEVRAHYPSGQYFPNYRFILVWFAASKTRQCSLVSNVQIWKLDTCLLTRPAYSSETEFRQLMTFDGLAPACPDCAVSRGPIGGRVYPGGPIAGRGQDHIQGQGQGNTCPTKQQHSSGNTFVRTLFTSLFFKKCKFHGKTI